MPPGKKSVLRFNPKSWLQWVLIALVIGIIVLSIFVFASSNSRNRPGASQTATAVITQEPGTLNEDEPLIAETDQGDAFPPTPDEIGYTDGIIFMSTLLILILLVGTLREVLHRRRQ